MESSIINLFMQVISTFKYPDLLVKKHLPDTEMQTKIVATIVSLAPFLSSLLHLWPLSSLASYISGLFPLLPLSSLASFLSSLFPL